ncbi:MAG: dual specificity protein phosphatase family protein [Bdellovibrio sp.]|nr:dual specificity protein phosphatase family protein [Bdellovibrio sp.]
MKFWFLLICLLLPAFALNEVSAGANNLHMIDNDKASGFAIFRYSKPSREDVRMLCDLGIDEVMVLSGTAGEREMRHHPECPRLKIVYNLAQGAKTPVTAEFLQFFDQWVAQARATGKKIAFRCECGCHRTGRLAAYYQMKYQGLTSADAIAIMMRHGKYMIFHPQLKPQVRDLRDFIDGLPCRENSKHCVIR